MDRLAPAVRAVVENLEVRCLLSADPLANQNLVQTLPFNLDFSSQVSGLHDKDGEDIGLTRVQINKNGINSSYLPANIDQQTDVGLLKITTTGTASAGSNYEGDNTLTNAVETQFDATTSGFSITTRLAGPLGYLSTASDQAGVYFGPDQDNYVKLVAGASPAGQKLQFLDEQTTSGVYTHVVNTLVDIGAFSAVTTLDLRLVGDAGTGAVQAFYAVNGGAMTKFPTDLVLTGVKRTAFFTAAARAGLIALNKNNLPPITASFDSFQILPGSSLSNRPTVVATRPAAGDTGVPVDAFIAADLHLPNTGLDASTITSANVTLYRTSDHAVIPGAPNTSGGGDTIILTPSVLLDPNTNYTFEITDQVKDTTGAAIIPFAMSFKTGTTGATVDPSLSFEKVALDTATGAGFTSVKVGPDHKLYASTDDGRILRFVINSADGTLGAPQTITSLQTANTGPRLITGFTFDPSSTANNLIIWVSNGYAAFDNVPDWTGKITRMSGPDLGTVQDYVINLPRSTRDHLTNQPSFGPDGKLYFAQGSNTAMGAPDNAWGNRNERMLSAAILQLDVAAATAQGVPVDVKTPEGGGTYNPATGPLKIYASGVRNAYDLVWTADGSLYAPTNGSAAGGNTPAGGGAPALTNVSMTENDWVYHVAAGNYYGHPDPARGQFVFNGGNPTAGVDPNEVAAYPVPQAFDPNYLGPNHDFGSAFNIGLNRSPDGALEYSSNSFGGLLKGKILVAEYSGGDDIAVLTRAANGDVVSVQRGIAGFKGFVDPLDLAEDTAAGATQGNLYVVEYGAQKITLLRPIPPGANLTTSKSQFVFNDIQTASTGGTGASPTQVLTITNTGTTALTFPAGGFSIVDDAAVAGDDSASFKIVNSATLPDTVQVGDSFTVQLNFTASSVGVKSAFLQILSNDSNNPNLKIALRGIGTTGTGGSNEPSLARILRAYQIPTIVGDGANDSGDATTAYPNPPDASSQEVVMPRLVKAAAGPVTIDVLAAMAINTNPSVRFGYYSPGTRDSKTELFKISSADAQSVNPFANGITNFDPGSAAFGIYSIFPGFTDATKDKGLPREVFSENALNTWDSNGPLHPDVRFFPLRNKDGSVVPNAFIFAFEEYDLAFDSNDIVGIIRNVQAAPAGPEIGLENLDGAPYPDRLAFSKIGNPDNSAAGKPNNLVHDTATVRVRGTGTAPLVINSLALSTGAPWQVVSTTPLNDGFGSADIKLKFIATGGGFQTGTLTINSNDADEPNTIVNLAGFWQSISEGGVEPTMKQVAKTFGYGTTILASGQVMNTGGLVSRVGDEVLSGYWKRADTSRAVSVLQLAAYHTQGNTATIKWYDQANSGTQTTLFTEDGVYAQSFFPPKAGTTSPAYALFSPASTVSFGFRVDSEWSDDTKNVQDGHTSGYGHHMRFWVVKDAAGNVVPNTYLMSMDYSGINYDYNDNVYLITNLKPVSPPSAPANLTAVNQDGGIFLHWDANTEGNLAGYNVYRGTSATGPFTKVNTNGLLTASQYTDFFAPTGVVSFYQVKAVDLSANESAAATASATRATDATPPASPANLTATPSANGIALDWSNNTEPDLAGYDVYRSDSAAGTFTKLNSSHLTTSSYNDLSAPSGAQSFYQVVAVDTAGNASAPATANATRPAVIPGAPATLTANADSPTQITLTWSPGTNAATYRVERMGPGEATFTEIAAGVSVTTFVDTGRTPGGTYSYRVRSETSAGLSPGYSPVASATTPQQGLYTSQDINEPIAGSTTVVTEGKDYDVVASGMDIYGTSDGFRFLYKQVTGDFDVQVQVQSLTAVNSATKAGLMARTDLTSGSANVFSYASASDGFRFTHRDTAGGTTSFLKTGTVAYPNVWVRLRRVGNVFTGFWSTNGTTWTQTSATTLALPSTLFFGMATTAHSTTATTTATFRNLADVAPAGTKPTAPATLSATASGSNRIDLSWAASTGATSYHVERKGPGETVFTEIASGITGTTFADLNRAASSTYSYQVRAENAAGLSGYSPVASATTGPVVSGSLISADINSTPAGSTTTINDGTDYDVVAGGVDIYGNSDGFRYVYKQVTGDFDVKVQVQSLTAVNSATKAGIMARADLTAGSANVFSYASASDGFRFSHRDTAGGTTSLLKTGTVSYPNVWVRLKRVGNVFTGYWSTNGTTWTQSSTTTLALPSTLFLGMAASAHSTTVTTTAKFRNFG